MKEITKGIVMKAEEIQILEGREWVRQQEVKLITSAMVVIGANLAGLPEQIGLPILSIVNRLDNDIRSLQNYHHNFKLYFNGHGDIGHVIQQRLYQLESININGSHGVDIKTLKKRHQEYIYPLTDDQEEVDQFKQSLQQLVEIVNVTSAFINSPKGAFYPTDSVIAATGFWNHSPADKYDGKDNFIQINEEIRLNKTKKIRISILATLSTTPLVMFYHEKEKVWIEFNGRTVPTGINKPLREILKKFKDKYFDLDIDFDSVKKLSELSEAFVDLFTQYRTLHGKGLRIPEISMGSVHQCGFEVLFDKLRIIARESTPAYRHVTIQFTHPVNDGMVFDIKKFPELEQRLLIRFIANTISDMRLDLVEAF